MKALKKLLCVLLIVVITNYMLFWELLHPPLWLGAVCAALLFVGFVVFNILPSYQKGISARLVALSGGYELLWCAAVCGTAEVFGYLVLCIQFARQPFSVATLVVNGIISAVLLFLMALNGCLRILFTSAQLGVAWRVALILLWWVPLVNLVLLWRFCRVARAEYRIETSKQELDNCRRENEVCHTKYPVLMVHGVFFRDWQYFNYWGRVPRALIKNGATVYYGNQQSADTIENSAQELKNQILKIVEEQHCEKVHIIAHSKGGLDARWAVSCLGMHEYVASLTTINTPHHGCVFVDKLLGRLPQGAIKYLAKKYNSTFARLGDKKPDFYAAVHELTAERCVLFNEQAKNSEGVLYQSVMSKMKNLASFGPPLCFTYPFIRHYEGENDGLVAVNAAKWGEYLGLLTASGRRGISHGDMIDLMRENIRGFDVREFYVGLVKNLKERGL